ncbi:CAP-Gly domain-containing linker protein 1 [Eumeta japonica]|uniref:CAP-Gly domain-containing linker protein 1 n=1 Tax=Eumeta variegata TaxID=151549 RepID=A0A4C1UND6_EUMVA|nr:CAP-Gly domain-containing linker protein 1 [Eumeta japonica]
MIVRLTAPNLRPVVEAELDVPAIEKEAQMYEGGVWDGSRGIIGVMTSWDKFLSYCCNRIGACPDWTTTTRPPDLRLHPMGKHGSCIYTELLREKQQHLERLMKERELERAEVARATLQVDRAETALAYLKKEAAQTTSENEKLRAELDRLSKLLEDEKQKVEDLMFRSEEENINREDYNKEKAAMEQRLRNLEAECALQAARADTAAGALRTLEDHRAAELATLADNHKEEIAAAHSLSSELQKLLDEAYALLKEKENEKDSLNKSMSDELTKLKLESERSINDAKTKMAIAQTEFETQLSVLTAKLQLAESKLEAEKQNVERSNKESSQTLLELNTKLTQLQAIIDDKTHELNKVLSTSKEHELNLNKEITKLKMELSAKILDMEQLNDSNQKHARDCTAVGNELAALKEQYNNKVNEYENLLNEASQQNDRNINEIVELKQNLTTRTKLYDKLLNDYGASRDRTERLVIEHKQTIHERDKEIIKLKNEYEEANANFNIKHSMIAEEHKKEIEDRNLKIEELLKEIDNHKQTLDKNKIEFDTLNSQLSTNIDEIKILSEQNQKLQKSVDELTQINSELKMKISSLELENGELQRQLQSSIETCKELKNAKEKVETEYLNLTGQTTDSNEQFNKLSQHLKDTEKEFQELKDKYREATNNHGRLEQELKQQIFRIQEEFSLEREKLFKTIESNVEKSKLLEGKINEYETQITSMKTKLNEQEANNDVILDRNTILQKEIEILKSKEIEIMNEYQAIRQKMEQDIDRYKEEITLLKDEGESSEVKLKEKVDQLIEAQNELNNKLEEARKHEDTLQKIVDDMSQQLANQKIQYENESVQLQTQINTVTEENANLKGEESRLKNSLQEKENYIKELDLKLNMLEVDLKSNTDIIAEKERQIMTMNEEFNMLIENKKQLEEKVNITLSENNQLKQTYDALVTNSNAECSIINEQQEKLDNLQKQLNDIIQNKADLESKLANNTVELQKINSEYEATSKLLQNNIDAKSKLEASLLEKEKAIQSQSEKNETEFKKLKTLEEELLLLKEDLEAKNNSIQEKDIQLANLNALLQSNANETQQKMSEIQSESLKLSEKYKTEVESLNKTMSNLQMRAAEHDKLVDEVTQQKQKVGELQVLLTKAEDDIKQLTNINNGQRGNYEDLNKQLQAQFDEYKKDSKKTKHELKNKLLEFENELKESKNRINDEIMKQTLLQKKLDEAESKVIDLTNKLELLNVQQSSSLEKDDKLEKLTLELQSIRKLNMETLANSETTIKNLKSDVEKKIKELDHKNNTISKLQDDLKSQIAKTEIMEREKVLLQKTAASNEAVVKDSNDNGLTTGQNDNKQKTQEDREMLDGQVSFLNSVIVDMQRKNEQLLARLLALEGGNSPPGDEGDAVFDEFRNGRLSIAVNDNKNMDAVRRMIKTDRHMTYHEIRASLGIRMSQIQSILHSRLGISPKNGPRQLVQCYAYQVQERSNYRSPGEECNGRSRAVAPRLFCDICEVFDAHDTEDCPRQAAPDPPPALGPRRAPPAPRPYCDICEVRMEEDGKSSAYAREKDGRKEIMYTPI